MTQDPIDRLVEIGFSEYEAKAYMALLRESPVSGYGLSKLSGVPRSMIYEVVGKLTARGAAITLHKDGATKYAPVPAQEFLDKLRHEHEQLIDLLQDDLIALDTAADPEYVWNIEGETNILAKAREAIGQAKTRIHLALLPATFPRLRPSLEDAIRRGVRVALYTTSAIELPGSQVIITPISEAARDRRRGLGLILVVDGEEVLVSEWVTPMEARASWTRSPLLVFIAEHHVRTDQYLPQIVDCLGDRAQEIIQKEDLKLFVHAMESRIDG